MWKTNQLNRCLSTLIHTLEPQTTQPAGCTHNVYTSYTLIPQVIHTITTYWRSPGATIMSGNVPPWIRGRFLFRIDTFPHRRMVTTVDWCEHIGYKVRNILQEKSLLEDINVNKMWTTPELSTRSGHGNSVESENEKRAGYSREFLILSRSSCKRSSFNTSFLTVWQA